MTPSHAQAHQTHTQTTTFDNLNSPLSSPLEWAKTRLPFLALALPSIYFSSAVGLEMPSYLSVKRQGNERRTGEAG